MIPGIASGVDDLLDGEVRPPYPENSDLTRRR